MTDTIAIDEAKTLQEADALVDQLAELLEHEFEALKAQDLDQFEALLSGKNHLLGGNFGRYFKAQIMELLLLDAIFCKICCSISHVRLLAGHYTLCVKLV